MTRVVPLLSCRRLAMVLAALVVLGVTTPVRAQRGQIQKSSPAVLQAFRGVVARPSESTVRVLCNDKNAALGTIVTEDGYILTKASELKGKPVCKLKDGRSFPAKIVGVEDKYDLAMLKIEAKGLKPIEWADSKSAEVGNWLASPGAGEDPVAIGVVSVAARKPARRDMPIVTANNAGYLGIGLDDGDGAPKIGDVRPRSPAAKAGLKVGDVVLKVSGRLVKTPESLVLTIQSFQAGKTITLEIKRGEEIKELTVTLDKRPANGGSRRADMQNSLGSKLSDRRGGFPAILQHDQVIKPTDCGGPLVDLDGKAVGVNIARAGRVESYAIPTDSVLALMGDLKSGKLAPKEDPVVAEAAVEELEKALAKARADVTRTERDLKALDEMRDDVQKKKKGLEAQLVVARKKLAEAQTALDKVKKDSTKK